MGGTVTPSAGRPHRRSHRGRHRRRPGAEFRAAVAPYASAIIALLVLGLGGLLVWKGFEYFLHGSSKQFAPASAPSPNASGAAGPASWQQDVLSAFDQAAQQVKSGNITGAEVDVDEATAEMEGMRVQSKAATNEFFGQASAALDRILNVKPNSAPPTDDGDAGSATQEPPQGGSAARLFEHVTQARIELAAMHSSQEPMPQGVDLASDMEPKALSRAANAAAATNAAASSPTLPTGGSLTAKLKLPAGHVAVYRPRELAANQLLDPAALGGTFLDATLMPEMAEILLPPASRQFSDNVRVENLTIAGGSQTLDGIRWRNTTFIDTRLRYEDGPLDLQNVRFIRCTFGFPSDARGAGIANAIALGQTTFMIQ